jgi:DNA-binding NarL/FixJ family response regulator
MTETLALPAARVLIVEDHPLYRDGLLAMLQRSAPLLQCRVADSADTALLQMRAHLDIDLVLSDLRLPGAMDGLRCWRVWAMNSPPPHACWCRAAMTRICPNRPAAPV